MRESKNIIFSAELHDYYGPSQLLQTLQLVPSSLNHCIIVVICFNLCFKLGNLTGINKKGIEQMVKTAEKEHEH